MGLSDAFSARWALRYIALGAGALLQFILYSDAPVWIRVVLPWLYLVLITWYWLRERSIRMQGSAPAKEAIVS